MNRQEAFLYNCLKKLDEIAEDNINNREFKAMLKIRSLIKTLPPILKNKLEPEMQRINQEIAHMSLGGRKSKRARKLTFANTEQLIDKVSTLLHENLRL